MIPIDSQIRTLVDALNRSALFKTRASCHGHPWQGKRPYVMFSTFAEVARDFEASLRRAWASGLTHHEWTVIGGADGIGRPVYTLEMFNLAIDEPWPLLSWHKVRQDFRLLAKLVDEFTKTAVEKFPCAEGQGDADGKHADDDVAQSALAINLLITDSPRTWLMPTAGTKLRRIGNFISALYAGYQRHGYIPYSLLTHIRCNDIVPLALVLTGARANPGTEIVECGCSSTPRLRLLSELPWVMFAGPTEQLAAGVQIARETAELTDRLPGAWQSVIVHDRALTPILLMWDSGRNGTGSRWLDNLVSVLLSTQAHRLPDGAGQQDIRYPLSSPPKGEPSCVINPSC